MEQDVDPAPGAGRAARPARPPTMQDIADRAGVSKGLVSLVLRGAHGPSASTRARVLRVAADLGYRANRTASMLARSRTRLLGVTMNLRNTFHAELVEDIQAAADEMSYEVVLSTVTRTHAERRAIETLLEFRCEAVLLVGPEEVPTEQLTDLGRQLPVVVIGRRVASTTVDVVRTADDDGIGQAVDHLVGLGHRRILHVAGGASDIAADRRRGYEEAMRRHRLARHTHVVPGELTEEAGLSAGRRLLTGRRLPTAVVAPNDRNAIGLIDALERRGVVVPDAISVTGYDNSTLAQLAHVSLTSVSQEPAEQANSAVAAAVERLEGRRVEPREVVLQPRLVVRGTTAPPPDERGTGARPGRSAAPARTARQLTPD